MRVSCGDLPPMLLPPLAPKLPAPAPEPAADVLADTIDALLARLGAEIGRRMWARMLHVIEHGLPELSSPVVIETTPDAVRFESTLTYRLPVLAAVIRPQSVPT